MKNGDLFLGYTSLGWPKKFDQVENIYGSFSFKDTKQN